MSIEFVFQTDESPLVRTRKLNGLMQTIGPIVDRFRRDAGRYDAPKTFDVGDTTPSVASKAKNFITANTGATIISAFDDGVQGQEILVLIGDTHTTIDFSSTTLKGNGGVDWAPANGDHMRCTFLNGNWYCQVTDSTP